MFDVGEAFDFEDVWAGVGMGCGSDSFAEGEFVFVIVGDDGVTLTEDGDLCRACWRDDRFRGVGVFCVLGLDGLLGLVGEVGFVLVVMPLSFIIWEKETC